MVKVVVDARERRSGAQHERSGAQHERSGVQHERSGAQRLAFPGGPQEVRINANVRLNAQDGQ